MNQYEASVVICCSNYSQKAERLKYLEECMVGLSVQTNLHFEVILVSHKNIDLVDSVRKKFAMTFPVSCVQTFTENLPIKRNMGIQSAKSNIVLFLDDDAIPNPNWVDTAITAFSSFNSIVIGGSFISYENAYLSRYLAIYYSWGRRDKPKNVQTVIGANMGIKKSECISIMGENTAIFNKIYSLAGDDSDFSLTINEAGGKIYFVPKMKVVHHYRTSIKNFLIRQVEYARGDLLVQINHPKSMYIENGYFIHLKQKMRISSVLKMLRFVFLRSINISKEIGDYWFVAALLKELSYVYGLIVAFRELGVEDNHC
ncbi:glycosyltransferase family 2 protein [Candidatus Dojkabacteria bacterium]|nr:glycosyltransferase family 2 protein [Candidatus Dojkabacteria bacterium]